MTEEITKYVKQRATLRGQITLMHSRAIIKALEKSIANQEKVNKFETIYDLDDQIFNLQIEADIEDINTEKALKYSEKLKFLKEYIMPTTSSEEPKETPIVKTKGYNKIDEKLLVKFDGHAQNYHEFITFYMARFDNNSDFDDIEKLQYLRASLTDEPKELLKHFSANQYQQARDLLMEQYGNPQRLKSSFFSDWNSFQLEKRQSKFDSTTLRRLHVKLLNFVNRAKQLEIGETYLDNVFMDQMCGILPFYLAKDIKRSKVTNCDEFLKTLNNEIKIIEDTEFTKKLSFTDSSNQSKPRQRVMNVTASNSSCCFCKRNNHSSYKCRQQLSLAERIKIVSDLNLCNLCLKPGHITDECTNRFQCRCGQRHSSKLCSNSNSTSRSNPILRNNNNANSFNRNNESIPNDSPSSSNNETNDNSQQSTDSETNSPPLHQSLIKSSDKTFYQTTMCLVNGIKCRVFYDNGAARTFITNALADRVKATPYWTRALHYGSFANPGESKRANQMVNITIGSIDDVYETVISAYLTDSIGDDQFESISEEDKLTLRKKNITVNDDPNYPVEMIIGLDFYHQLVRGDSSRLNEKLKAEQTVLGWVISGYNNTKSVRQFAITTCCDLDKFIKHENEMFEEKNEDDFEKNYKANHIRLKQGRYEADLPFIDPIIKSNLSNNYKLALNRLNQQITSLKKRQLFDIYEKEMNEFLKNYAEPANEVITDEQHYLPHHLVVKEGRTTTKYRLVHDAAARDKDGMSLNDVLFKGRVICDNIDILIRFRLKKYALVGDITRAFLMISINPNDRDYIRFLWTADNKPQTYRMHRLLFGATSSPFILYSTLQKHFESISTLYPQTIELIKDNFYIDDMILSVNDIKILQTIKSETSEILSQAFMVMTKWMSNDSESMKKWKLIQTDTKVLGILWSPTTDELNIKFEIDEHRFLSKRSLLSILSTIHDPLGLVAPAFVNLKLCLRDCWIQKCEWDDELPPELKKRVAKDLLSICRIPTFKFKRAIFTENTDIILNIFCDGSKDCFGVCAYATSITLKSSHLIFAKSKLAKSTTIPIIELVAIEFATKIAKRLKPIVKPNSIIIWSDSMLNVNRTMNHPNKYAYPIARRLINIKLNVHAEIKHIEGKSNPADLLTRVFPIDKIGQPLWLYGPSMLTESSTYKRPNLKRVFMVNADQENAKIITNYTVRNIDIPSSYYDLFKDTTDYYKILKVANIFNKIYLLSHPTQETQILNSLRFVILIFQNQVFKREMNCLLSNKPIPFDSLLHHYDIFIDEHRIIRIRTRLQNAQFLSFEQKNPIILPYSNFAYAIVRFEHVRNGHAGRSQTLSSVRDKYYLLQGQKIVKNVINKFLPCQIFNKEKERHQFGQLPEYRINPNDTPFTCIGIDYFGSLYVKKYYFRIGRKTTQLLLLYPKNIDNLTLTDTIELYKKRQNSTNAMWSLWIPNYFMELKIYLQSILWS